MRERGATLPLWWVLGTFHTIALVVVLVWLVYRGGGLGTLLASLSTLAGIALFLALWATTSFATRRALAGLDWMADEPGTMGVFFWRAFRWGAANGMLFLVALGLIQLANPIANPAPGVNLGAVLLSAVFLGSFGLVFAAVIGALIGVTLGALDIAALRIGRSMGGRDGSSAPRQ